MKPKVLVLADAEVGLDCVTWLLERYPGDIAAVVVVQKNKIFESVASRGITAIEYRSEESLIDAIRQNGILIDLGLLIWWPRIISKQLIEISRNGFVNTHPSLLPHNRGRNPNHWAIVEGRPYGVTLHLVDEGVDSGSIVAQREIEITWEDTAESIYKQAQNEMVLLFQEKYESLRSFSFDARPQTVESGSLHFGSEFSMTSRLSLDRATTVREVLNQVRARMFTGHPACRFEENGTEYEVQIKITRVA